MKEEFDKELRELSPLLNYLKKEQGADAFKVPKFYFDNLADKVITQAKKTEKVGTNPKKDTPQYPTALRHLQDFVGSLFSPRLALAFGSCLLIAVVAWFIVSLEKTVTLVNEATVSITPSTNTGQLANGVESENGRINPFLEHNTPIKEQKDAVTSRYKLITMPNDALVSAQNTTKLGETSGENTLAEGGQLVHPQSGLTEEELAMYLGENTDENNSDDSDGSDNNL